MRYLSRDMRKLQDSDVVRIIREEYARKLKVLTEKISLDLVSQGLKVRDKDDAQYTVTRVGSWGVELSSVELDGSMSYKKINRKEFEENFSTPVEARKEGAKANREKDEENGDE